MEVCPWCAWGAEVGPVPLSEAARVLPLAAVPSSLESVALFPLVVALLLLLLMFVALLVALLVVLLLLVLVLVVLLVLVLVLSLAVLVVLFGDRPKKAPKVA